MFYFAVQYLFRSPMLLNMDPGRGGGVGTIEWPKYSVDQRAVRYRFVKLENGYKRKTREELKASGIAPPEMSELDQALEEISERK